MGIIEIVILWIFSILWREGVYYDDIQDYFAFLEYAWDISCLLYFPLTVSILTKNGDSLSTTSFLGFSFLFSSSFHL